MTATVPLIRYTCDHHGCDATAYAPADPGRVPPSWLTTNIDGHIAFSKVKHLCPDHADQLARTVAGWQTEVDQ